MLFSAAVHFVPGNIAVLTSAAGHLPIGDQSVPNHLLTNQISPKSLTAGSYFSPQGSKVLNEHLKFSLSINKKYRFFLSGCKRFLLNRKCSCGYVLQSDAVCSPAVVSNATLISSYFSNIHSNHTLTPDFPACFEERVPFPSCLLIFVSILHFFPFSIFS